MSMVYTAARDILISSAFVDVRDYVDVFGQWFPITVKGE